MSDTSSTPSSSEGRETPQSLAPGAVLGGIYRLEEQLGAGGLGPLFRAVDERSGATVALRVLNPELLEPMVLGALKRQMELAAGLEHKNVARTFGVATAGEVHFVVSEHVAGQSLREIIERKRRASKPFTLKGAYNIAAHLCNACGHVHETMFHGALHPGNVLVNRAGRVKLSELGYAPALSALGNFESLLGHDGYLYLAPEMIQAPGDADPRADIYAIGVILNELLTGRSPADSFETPSTVRPGLPVEVDQVIGRCLRPDPAERFDTIQELKLALMGALEGASEVARPAPAAPAGVGDVELDIDIDLDAREVPAPASTASALPADLPPPPGGGEGDDPFALPAGTDGGIGGGQDAFDLDALISEAAGEEDEKYLISKKGLDFGPFSMVEVKRQIASGEIQPSDVVVEIDTGKRTKVKAHPLTKDFTKEVVRRREARRRAEAEMSTEAGERRKRRVLVVGVVIALGVIGLGVGSILIYQGYARKKEGLKGRSGDEFSYQGSDEESGGKGRRGHRGRHWRRGHHGGSVGLNKKLADTQSFDFAGGGGGGSERLSSSVIKSVIDRRRSRVGNCMISAGAKSLSVFVQVRGNGRLAYVSAKPKSATGCVRRALRGLRFPKFNGKVTQGNYYLSM